MKHRHNQHQQRRQWSTYLYFAYGANTNLASMKQRCPDAKSLGAATLHDWQFRFARHADVVPCLGDRVEGVLWEITEECLASLDAFEGFPSYYGRQSVTVRHGARNVEALVYTMTPGHTEALPSDHYLDTLAEGYVAHGVSIRQLCDAYAEAATAELTGVSLVN